MTSLPVRHFAPLLLLLLTLTSLAFASDPVLDVEILVLGSEPEAITAAVAAAESGARVALVSEDPVLGGLFTLGKLTVLDTAPSVHMDHDGVFGRWWTAVGDAPAFDPDTAEVAFATLLEAAGVQVVLDVDDLEIRIDAEGRATGATWRGVEARAPVVIDGDADLRYASAAGATSDVGWSAWGEDERMVDTLVLGIDGVNWTVLADTAERRGEGWATVTENAAFGSFEGIPAAYVPRNPRLALRGLNLGRDDGGRVWMNALLIANADPFDRTSRSEARRAAILEAPAVIAYLRSNLPGFEAATFAAAAERLYVRETRHLHAVCTLTGADVLGSVANDLSIAVGRYPMDLQAFPGVPNGAVFGVPVRYGIPLCAAVPVAGPPNVWTVGRSIGIDPAAHTSARVVPTGMAVAEAVGIAAVLAQRAGVEPRTVSVDPAFVAEVRTQLRARGALRSSLAPLPPVGPEGAEGDAFRVLASRGLAVGGYGNDPDLEALPGWHAYRNLLAGVARRFLGAADVGRDFYRRFEAPGGAADALKIAELQGTMACLLELPCRDGIATPDFLGEVGLWPAQVPSEGALTRGELFLLAERMIERANGHSLP